MPDAVRLGLAMTAIQFSIGALNDVVDAPRDRGRVPVKPVADGLVSRTWAIAVAVAAAGAGFALSAASGGSALVVAAFGAACGYVYDLRLSRTSWSWLPLSIALPLVPVYAWVGATGTVPDGLLALLPVGMLAGGGLAVGNALADLTADTTAGAPSLAIRLGRGAAWRVHALALGGAVVLAVVFLPADPPPASVALFIGGLVVLAGGVAALALATSPSKFAVARVGWQAEALGIALIGVGWVLALSTSLSVAV